MRRILLSTMSKKMDRNQLHRNFSGIPITTCPAVIGGLVVVVGFSANLALWSWCLKIALRPLIEDLDKLSMKMEEGSKEMNESFDRLSKEMNESFDRLSKEMNESFDRLDTKFDGLSKKMEERTDKLTKEINDYDAKNNARDDSTALIPRSEKKP